MFDLRLFEYIDNMKTVGHPAKLGAAPPPQPKTNTDYFVQPNV